MNGLLLVVFFILGLSIGSFLNVVIYRLPRRIPFFRLGERSRCPFCKKELETRDLIPVVSFIFLHGKCRHCKKHISWQYLIVELVTALAFTALFFSYGFTLPLLVGCVAVSFAIPIIVIDARHKIVPDALSIPFIGSSLILGLLTIHPWYGVFIGGAIGFLFFLLQWVVSKGKWIGSGDIRLGLGMGLLLGWEFLLVALALAYFSGTLFAIILLARKKKKLKATIPFGPYLLMAMLVALFFGARIIEWYLAIYIYPI